MHPEDIGDENEPTSFNRNTEIAESVQNESESGEQQLR
jgi:hypothetical protein